MKFFRKFRQQVFEQGKVRPYLVYATGEIVLVVMGILIAFAIDNVNDQRIRLNLEKRTYQELRTDLQESLRDAQSDLRGHLQALESSKIVQKHLFQKAAENDSLIYHFVNTTNDRQFDPKTSTFESLLSQGINLLRNDDVRQYISGLFLDLGRLETQGQYSNPSLSFEFIMAPYVSKYIALKNDIEEQRDYMDSKVIFDIYKYRFINYRNLLSDESLKVDLQKAIIKRGNLCGRYYESIAQIEHALGLIQQELERLD